MLLGSSGQRILLNYSKKIKPPNMFMRFRLLTMRLLVLFALAVCAGQLADHLSGAGAFCQYGDTCDQVTSSVYGKPLGVPLPAIGLVGFAVLYALTLIPTEWAIRLFRVLAGLAGLLGIGLLVIQFAVLHKVCPMCLTVDIASIVLAGIALISRPEPAAISKFRLFGWIVLAAVTLLVPVTWTAVQLPMPVPQPVQDHWVVGEITVVEVTDFDCPYCQQADVVLREVLKNHHVNFVRLVAPMPSHDNAIPAALAYFAARQLGKGEEMAEALYKTDTRTAARCREIAATLELNLSDYDRIIADPATSTEYRSTLNWVKNYGKGVPLTWVQNELFLGVPSQETLDKAIRTAKPPLKLNSGG
jgi:uncharacterized membrane protein